MKKIFTVNALVHYHNYCKSDYGSLYMYVENVVEQYIVGSVICQVLKKLKYLDYFEILLSNQVDERVGSIKEKDIKGI